MEGLGLLGSTESASWHRGRQRCSQCFFSNVVFESVHFLFMLSEFESISVSAVRSRVVVAVCRRLHETETRGGRIAVPHGGFIKSLQASPLWKDPFRNPNVFLYLKVRVFYPPICARRYIPCRGIRCMAMGQRAPQSCC